MYILYQRHTKSQTLLCTIYHYHGWWPAESSDNESVHRMSFKTMQRGPRHKSDLGLSKGMPRPQMQYTNCNWWHAESEEDERTSRASSKSTSTSSRHKVHRDNPKKPSWPMGKPHSSASYAYDVLETHKVSNRPPVAKTPKLSQLPDDAGPLNDSPRSPRDFSDNVPPIQSEPETHKVSKDMSARSMSKPI
jgi:hypothetical protein